MDDITVAYHGYVFDASGYGYAARAYIHALHAAGVRLSVSDLAGRGLQVHDNLVESLLRNPDKSADFHIFHGIPTQWSRSAYLLPNAIGMTVWETDAIPHQWRNPLNHTLEVWLPCEHNVNTFARDLKRPIFKLPHPIFPRSRNGAGSSRGSNARESLGISDSDFVYYCIIEWQERKNPEGAIESYLRALPDRADALFFIKTNPSAEKTAHATLEAIRARIGSKARVEIRAEAWDDARIDALHQRGDCYISLHRGEGWCYPLFEAASRGKPVVSTGYSGPLDYLDPESHLLVRYSPARVGQRYIYYNPRMTWAEPDLAHAAELIRQAFDNRADVEARAAAAAPRIREAYSLEAVGELARKRLTGMLETGKRPPTSRSITRGKRDDLVPTIPIPAEWYDQDYFDNGLKSNWDKGFTWGRFGELFTNTAAFLNDVFRDASSYLDAGCAKGYLVRALREQGKDCWGFDHSRCAIEHAEESIRPFLFNAGFDEVSFGRRFDVLTAFSILETLTESQALAFLSRAREWTTHAIVAVIPTFESEEAFRSYNATDRDLSHVTMKSRAWWHELFLRAGWRQGPMTRIVERMCQSHALPSRMGWSVYVYAGEEME